MANQNVVINLEARDNASGVIGALTQQLRKLGRANSEVDKLAQQFGKTMKDANQIMSTGETKAKMFARHYLETQEALSNVPQKMEEIGRAAEDMGAKVQKSGLSFRNLASLTLAFTGVQLGIQMVGNALRNSIRMAQEYNTQLIGVQTTANNFGVSQKEINRAVQELTQTGFVTQGEALGFVGQMLSSYVTNMDQVIAAGKKFLDLGASGGDASLTLGQKLNKLGEAFLTEMSILGNNAGMQENWNQIIKIGEQVLGKKVEQMSYVERQQLKLAGVTAIHARAEGAANELAKTHIGTMQQSQTNMKNLQLELGRALIPALGHLAGAFNSATTGGKVMIQAVRGIGVAVMGVIAIIKAASIAIGTLFNTARAATTSGINAAKQAWKEGGQEMLEQMASVQETVTKIWKGEIGPEIQGVLGGVGGWAEDASAAARKAHKKMLEDLRKESERFERELEKRNRDFKRSLADLVWAHKDKVRDIESQLADETATFERNNARRVRDYERSLEDMEKAHNRKIRDINQDVEDELERHARSRDKIQEEIREEEQKGIMLFGQWNSQADQDRLKDLKRRLEEEDYQHSVRLRDLETKLNDETSDYAEALDRKTEIFNEETERAKESYQERKSALETTLAEEREILNKHQKLVAQVKDMAKEDDIERLVRQNEEERAEMARAHQERMTEIVKQAQEAGGAYGGGFNAAAGPGLDELDEEFKNMIFEHGDMADEYGFKHGDVYGGLFHDSSTPHFKNVEEAAKSSMVFMEDEFKKGGKKSGKGFIGRLFDGIKDAYKKLEEKGLNQVILAGLGGPLAQLGALVDVLSHQHGGIVPGSPNQAVPIIAHGGERVVPRAGVDVNSRGGGSGVTINMTGPVSMNSQQDIDYLAERIVRTIGRTNELERLGVGR